MNFLVELIARVARAAEKQSLVRTKLGHGKTRNDSMDHLVLLLPRVSIVFLFGIWSAAQATCNPTTDFDFEVISANVGHPSTLECQTSVETLQITVRNTGAQPWYAHNGSNGQFKLGV